MDEGMPWVNLTDKEVEELRAKKHELTEYGKQRLKELMNKDLIFKTNGEEKFRILFSTPYVGTKCPEMKLEVTEMTHEEMLEESAQREAERKALDALDEIYEKHGDAMLRLAEIEKDEWERRDRADTILARYNRFYNDECSGMPHGTPITPEHMQAIALECMIDALRCENMNVEYDVIAIDDIKDLIEGLYRQSNEFLERVRKNNG